jgi:hypothetical protein
MIPLPDNPRYWCAKTSLRESKTDQKGKPEGIPMPVEIFPRKNRPKFTSLKRMKEKEAAQAAVPKQDWVKAFGSNQTVIDFATALAAPPEDADLAWAGVATLLRLSRLDGGPVRATLDHIEPDAPSGIAIVPSTARNADDLANPP